VVLLSADEPGRADLIRAALLYAGPGAVVTGRDALAAAGVRQPRETAAGTPQVHLLLPASRRIHNTGFVACERTTRLPEPWRVRGLDFAPPVRATLDAARRMHDKQTLAALLTPAVKSGRCPLPQLFGELDAGSQRGSALPRAVLAELRRGLHTALRHRALRAVASAGLPEPAWDAPVCDGSGAVLGVLDAYWDRARLAWDYGSPEPGGVDEAARRGRDALLAARGVLVLRTSPPQLRDDARAVQTMLATAYRRAAAAA
jgi:hypothetical protein